MSEAVAKYEILDGFTAHGSAGDDGLSFSRMSYRERLSALRCGQNLRRASVGTVIRDSRARYFPETLLHAAWKRAGAASATVAARDGHSYRVIYPGRPADGAGPDFRDAVLLRDDGFRVHGHVEVHVRPGDWNSHGHAADSAYNGVVLHVVGEESGPLIDTPSGVRIPLLVLDRQFMDQVTGEATSPDTVHSSVPLPSLDMSAAGDEWFMNRAHGYPLQLSAGIDQALWEGALECLGYPANKRGFRQLAARLPWCLVNAFVNPGADDSRRDVDLKELLLWAAGFGAKPHEAPSLPGKAPEWRPRHGRPANSPRSRLQAAAAWAVRWNSGASADPTLSETFIRTVEQARTPRDLTSLFIVTGEQNRTSQLGLSRARDIVVNHLLPAVYALASAQADNRLMKHARSLFEAHPLLESNSITREASRLLRSRGANGRPRTARDQQGLIHIYRMAVASQQPERQLPLL